MLIVKGIHGENVVLSDMEIIVTWYFMTVMSNRGNFEQNQYEIAVS